MMSSLATRLFLASVLLTHSGFTLGLGARSSTAQPPVASERASAQVMRQGRALVQQFYAVKIEPVWATFTPDLRVSLGSLASFRSYREAGVREYGAEIRVLSERFVEEGGLRYYVRTAVFERHPAQAWSVIVGFDARNRVATFAIVLAGELEESQDLRT